VGLLAAARAPEGAVASGAEREIAADAYLDKLHGMWMGQILGNYAGRGMVPGTDRKREGYVVRGGGDYDVGWDAILATTTWLSDDDTQLEYLYASLLGGTADPDAEQIRQAWLDNVPTSGIYIANKQARWLMEPPPVGKDLAPPQTGSLRHNMHWYAIDAQIATESLGALTPGMRQRASDLCGRFAHVTNEGYPVHAAQFYAAMYAAAALDGDVESVVAQGLAVVPTTSRTHEVIEEVRQRYEADRDANGLADPNAWRQTQALLYDRYGTYSGSNERYRGWIESTVNVGLTTMALLYGQGDFMRTVEIAVLGGYDADCNPATAGGLVGMIRGYCGADGQGGILAELPATPTDDYDVTYLRSVGKVTTVSQVAADLQQAAEAQILAAGGLITGSGADRTYTLGGDDVLPPVERPDPTEPAGLVGRVLRAGGAVATSASVERHVPTNDRYDLDAIIDGITDLTFNGHMPYFTRYGQAGRESDYYQLTFDRAVTFGRVVFYEGDIVWSDTNGNPRAIEPRGGYFTWLTVEVGRGGEFREVSGLRFGEPLDANAYFQRIELTFDAAWGEAVRIRGGPGGTEGFTTIVELEAYGAMGVPGDADEDGDVDRADFLALRGGFGSGSQWQDGDFNFDGSVDAYDYVAMKRHLGPPGAVPEPAAILLLVAAAAPLVLRRRRAAQAAVP
jgi:hypothetical protein